jgi:hypothetical protein
MLKHELPLMNHELSRIKCKRIMKKKGFWEVVIRIAIAALTAALTALGTTSCMGYGPF